MFGDTVTQIPIRRALISVYDKTGLEELASGLHAAGVDIVSTGSTAARIAAAGVPVTPVEELTGGMKGRQGLDHGVEYLAKAIGTIVQELREEETAASLARRNLPVS